MLVLLIMIVFGEDRILVEIYVYIKCINENPCSVILEFSFYEVICEVKENPQKNATRFLL